MSIIDELTKFIVEDWSGERSFVRLLALPIIFSGFGAFFGAKTASNLRQREEQYKHLKELAHKQNMAAQYAASICGASLSLKRQHVKDACEKYFRNREVVLREYGTPTVHKTLYFDFDFVSFLMPHLFVDELLSCLNDVAGQDGRDVSQLVALKGSIENLRRVMDLRNDWISSFRENKDDTEDTLAVALYFGIEHKQGFVDKSYFDYMESLRSTCDEVIFHSACLHDRLIVRVAKTASEIRKTYKEKYEFSFADFSKGDNIALFPDLGNYAEWLEQPKKLNKPWGRSLKYWESQLLIAAEAQSIIGMKRAEQLEGRYKSNSRSS